MNTHGIIVTFGKYKSQLLTRVPVGYLQWSISNGVKQNIETSEGIFSFDELAQAEMLRRGERIQTCEISPHAIDRLSQRFIKKWEETRNKNKNEYEGLYSWAQRMTLQALRNTGKMSEDGKITVRLNRMVFVIQTNTVYPTLLTVK
jgi:hypothetical protein